MLLLLLVAIFIGPFVLGAKLLGASWLLAAFVGLVIWPALVVTYGVFLFLHDVLDQRAMRKRTNARRAEAGLPPLKGRL